jgi:branched-chain amino acid transport system permease protein
MDSTIASLLAADGLVNGAVYALMSIAIILVFSVTRILFIAQGEFFVFGAATLYQLQNGSIPSAVWLLMATTALCLLQTVALGYRESKSSSQILRESLRLIVVPSVVAVICFAVQGQKLPTALAVLLTLGIVTPLGPLLHRLVYRSLSTSSVLTLLIVSVGVHFGLTSLALALLGPEGFRTAPFSDYALSIGPVSLSGQGLVILAASAALIAVLSVAFSRSFQGMALRATAVNQLGARIVGLSADRAGQISFALAAALGALSGMLIAPTVTIFYDTGFLIGLKGFVAAVFAGLASFPGAMAGAIVVGLIESYASFLASAFKDAVVFAAVLPILLWRSMTHGAAEEH